MKIHFTLLCGWLLATAVVHAQDVTCVVSSASSTLFTQGTGAIWIACLNSSADSIRHDFPEGIDGTFVSGNQHYPVHLKRLADQPATATIPAGGFARCEYQFVIPPAAAGSMTLQLHDLNPVVLQVNRSPAPAAGAADAAAAPQTPKHPAPNAPREFFGPAVSGFIGNHISTYEPIYFLLGTYPAAEFQFSLKYKLLNFDSAWNPFGHTYFAYTQTSFWDLLNEDPSFYDTSYKPSAFLYYTNVTRSEALQLDLQGGVEHESNGRGGPEERALNTAYLQPTLRLALPAEFEFDVQPRVWGYLSKGHNNPDLAEYRGYGDLRCSFCRWIEDSNSQRAKQFELAARLRIGDHASHAGWLFDLRYNLPVSWKINPALDIQYFTGYGQTLRQYDQFSTGWRAGFCLWY